MYNLVRRWGNSVSKTFHHYQVFLEFLQSKAVDKYLYHVMI